MDLTSPFFQPILRGFSGGFWDFYLKISHVLLCVFLYCLSPKTFLGALVPLNFRSHDLLKF